MSDYLFQLSQNLANEGNQRDIWDFCRNDTDILYMHLSLVRVDNPDLERVTSERIQTPFYFDAMTPIR